SAPVAPADDFLMNAPGDLAGLEKEKKRDEMASNAGAVAGAPAATAAAGQAQQKDAFATAMDLYSQGRYEEAEKAFDAVAGSGSKNAAQAALLAAKSADNGFGCGKALAKYENVMSRWANTSSGFEAMYGAANCYKATGDSERARKLYTTLMGVAG